MSRFLGEGRVVAGGETYLLRFDMNVLAEIEEETGRSSVEVLAEMDGGSPSIKTLRMMCRAMLMRHHPDATVQTAGDILSEDMDGFMKIVQAAMPADKDGLSGNGRAKAGRRR